MFIPDLGSRFLPIPDPGSENSNKRERRKKISCHAFLCSHKFHKIVCYFSFEVLKKKIWANFQRIIELFTKKIVKKLLKIWSWDPGSGKNLFPDRKCFSIDRSKVFIGLSKFYAPYKIYDILSTSLVTY
jgi:hypothetical protein